MKREAQRLSPDSKTGMDRSARRREISLFAREQLGLQKAAAKCFGAFAGNDAIGRRKRAKFCESVCGS